MGRVAILFLLFFLPSSSFCSLLIFTAYCCPRLDLWWTGSDWPAFKEQQLLSGSFWPARGAAVERQKNRGMVSFSALWFSNLSLKLHFFFLRVLLFFPWLTLFFLPYLLTSFLSSRSLSLRRWNGTEKSRTLFALSVTGSEMRWFDCEIY